MQPIKKNIVSQVLPADSVDVMPTSNLNILAATTDTLPLLLVPEQVPELSVPEPVRKPASQCNSCSWTCSMLPILDHCAKCQVPVHRVCQSKGEKANGWLQHGKSALCCPSCHPDAPAVAAAAVPPSVIALVPDVVPNLAAAADSEVAAVLFGSCNLHLGGSQDSIQPGHIG